MMRLVLLRICETYFRHRWLYLFPLVLLIGLSAAYEVYAPPVYVASGTMYVQKQSLITSLTSGGASFSWTTPAQATVSELRELLQTDAFVRSAIKATSLESNMAGGPQAVAETILQFRDATDFQVLGDNLVMISGKHKDPRLAQQVVNATLGSYVQWKLNADNQDSVAAQDFFSKILQPYQVDLDKARANMRAYLLDHPDPVRGERPMEEKIRIQELQDAIDQAQERVKSAMEKMENARLAQSKAESELRQSYAVVDAPKLPLRPEKRLRDRVKEITIFLAVGLMLSTLGILGAMLLDRSLRLPFDVRRQLGLPVLAIVPDVAAEMVKIRDRLPRIMTSDENAQAAFMNDPLTVSRPHDYIHTATTDQLQPPQNGSVPAAGPTPPPVALFESLHPNGTSNAYGGYGENTNGYHSLQRMQKLTLQSVDSAVMEAVQRRYDSSTDMTQRLHYQIVMLAHRGRSVAQIVDTMFYSRDAVEYILGQFLSGGVDAIPRMLPQGIRRIEVPAWEAELLRIINMSPRSVGVDSERWTTRRAAEYLAAELHVRIRAETISLFLHRHGYTCKNRVWRREHPVEEPIALLEAPQFKTNGLMDDDVMDN